MKQKRNTSFSEVIYGTRLFRDDIEEILTLLANKSLKIQVHDSNNIYDSLDEISNLRGNSPKEIQIEAINTNEIWERVSIHFKKYSVFIYADGSETLYTLGFELKDFFKSKVPWHFNVFSPWYLAYTIVPAIFLISFSIDKNTHVVIYPWMLWISGSLFALFILSLINRPLSYGFTLARRHEHGFWNRNKDKILLTILGVIFGSLLTLLIQRLTQ